MIRNKCLKEDPEGRIPENQKVDKHCHKSFDERVRAQGL